MKILKMAIHSMKKRKTSPVFDFDRANVGHVICIFAEMK